MFLWMFIEGLYLHNVVTVTVFQGRFPHYLYASIGWGLPIIMTVRDKLKIMKNFILACMYIFYRQFGQHIQLCRKLIKSAGLDII
jgi:hypothetical protein